ncbi:hypothetical protein GCM10020218_106710 [Dactylosporangium vinaceum]
MAGKFFPLFTYDHLTRIRCGKHKPLAAQCIPSLQPPRFAGEVAAADTEVCPLADHVPSRPFVACASVHLKRPHRSLYTVRHDGIYWTSWVRWCMVLSSTGRFDRV